MSFLILHHIEHIHLYYISNFLHGGSTNYPGSLNFPIVPNFYEGKNITNSNSNTKSNLRKITITILYTEM